MKRNKPQQFKILRSNDGQKRAFVFECGRLSMKLSSTRSTVDVETLIAGRNSVFCVPRSSCAGMAALMRAVADDLERM